MYVLSIWAFLLVSISPLCLPPPLSHLRFLTTSSTPDKANPHSPFPPHAPAAHFLGSQPIIVPSDRQATFPTKAENSRISHRGFPLLFLVFLDYRPVFVPSFVPSSSYSHLHPQARNYPTLTSDLTSIAFEDPLSNLPIVTSTSIISQGCQ